MANESHAIDTVFRALSDPTRRAIVERLGHGRVSVTALAAPFAMALPSFMKHLHVLEESGLIDTEKTGRVRSCGLRIATFGTVDDWMARQRSVWEQRTDRLEQFVINKQG